MMTSGKKHPTTSSEKRTTSSEKRPTTSDTPGSDAWLNLRPGDQLKVKSHTGNEYEATLVYAGMDDAGLYVRLGDGRLARLVPDRVNWKTLQRMGKTEPLKPGDEVVMLALGGAGVRGKITSPLDDRIVVAKETGTQIAMSPKEAELKRFRLLFHTKSLRSGDEFTVRSRSGRDMTGRVLGVTETKITALLRPTKEKVSIRIDHLDLDTLFVLIPVLGARPTSTP
jgi:hypothetical protein